MNQQLTPDGLLNQQLDEMQYAFFADFDERVRKGTSSPLSGFDVWMVRIVTHWVIENYEVKRK